MRVRACNCDSSGAADLCERDVILADPAVQCAPHQPQELGDWLHQIVLQMPPGVLQQTFCEESQSQNSSRLES